MVCLTEIFKEEYLVRQISKKRKKRKKEKEKKKRLQPKFVGYSSGPDTVDLLAKSYLILRPK